MAYASGKARRGYSANIPTILIIFGATGDLIGKKILPALFRLHCRKALPDRFCVVGVSRRNMHTASFRRYLRERLIAHNHISRRADVSAFLACFRYHKGLLDTAGDYHALSGVLKGIDDAWGICTNKLFYLAVPPELYETVFRHLAASGLTIPCGPNEGWTRVIVEKPFGRDRKTAERLDALLGTLFKEEQIYRIDHYLAKEMLQNILTFRFANDLFESEWNSRAIEKIEIRLLEKIGAEGRGSFYDGVGALRDVGQNHLLQMLALVTMERPLRFDAAAIRKKRAELLATLKPPSAADIRRATIRAQYTGYRAIPGVDASSKTETYFKVRAFLNSPRWRGMPITLESGKRLGKQEKDITVHLRHPVPCMCPPGEHRKNKIVIRLEPQEDITVTMWAKKPMLGSELEERRLHFLLRRRARRSQYTEEYEKLLLDCVAGNQTLFISTDEVRTMWRYIDPVVRAWEQGAVPLLAYKPGARAVLGRAWRAVEEGRARAPKEIGIVGLGKMGGNIARRLVESGWTVHGYNRSANAAKRLEKEGMRGSYSLDELVRALAPPRLVWLMLPAGEAVEKMLFDKNGIVSRMDANDIIIDAGNSFYKDSIRREKLLKKRGIRFLDAGVSGGPGGARAGAAIMIGGDKKTYDSLHKLWSDLSVPGGYGYMGPAGAGHFVKMVHNGIEYGMMQAIAEGFAILKESRYRLDLKEIARVYSRGTVIESRLIDWLMSALELHGPELRDVSGSVAHTGEGKWTAQTAREEKVEAKIIEEAARFRVASEKLPSYTGKILSALREQFGGHEAWEKR